MGTRPVTLAQTTLPTCPPAYMDAALAGAHTTRSAHQGPPWLPAATPGRVGHTLGSEEGQTPEPLQHHGAHSQRVCSLPALEAKEPSDQTPEPDPELTSSRQPAPGSGVWSPLSSLTHLATSFQGCANKGGFQEAILPRKSHLYFWY